MNSTLLKLGKEGNIYLMSYILAITALITYICNGQRSK